MSKMKLKIRGAADPAATGKAVEVGTFSDVFKKPPAYETRFNFRPSDRSQVRDHDFEPDEDDLVEVLYENGARRYMRVGRLADEFGLAPSRGSSERVITAEAFSSGGERGVGKEVVEGLQLFGVDLPNMAGKKLADFLGERIEGRFNREPGLYRVAYGDFRSGDEVTAKPTELVPTDQLPADKPMLVFIHGTGSNFVGSFGALWQLTKGEQETGQQRLERWKHFLTETYGRDVYALEHPTLTASPTANALSLLDAIGKNARLHLVSHSRGGLVGELIARAQIAKHGRGKGRNDKTPILDKELEVFRRNSRPGRESQLQELRQLSKLLQEKKPSVERFVRVACPTRGTTLADGKLDDWLSGFASLIERFVGESDIYYFIKTLTLAVIKQKADPSVLPGLEAMMSDSPFIALINSGPTLDADLSVIAGDTDSKGWIPWMWPVDRFFATEHFPEGRNDLVVPTRSMGLGHRRSAGRGRSFEDRGSSVNHFNYFGNRKTYERLVAGLARTENTHAGFTPVRGGTEIEKRGAKRTTRGTDKNRPRVIMIPGISGSHIKVKDDRIWFQIHEILFGQLTKLDLHGKGTPGDTTGADGIIDKYYGDLADFLRATHEVETFDYDWRLPLADSAKNLDKKVRELLQSDQPVRIVAHSMGGLVVRAWIGKAATDRSRPEAATWDRFKRNPDSRIVMLGTPSLGSYSIPRLLLGRDALIKTLDRADPFHSTKELLAVFNRFPGILTLLPRDTDFDFKSLDLWRQIKSADEGDWPLPLEADLQMLEHDWRLLEDRHSLDVERMVYVAGQSDTTPVGLEIQDNGERVVFEGTALGDGRVPWATGIPQPLEAKKKVWYMPAVHGDMCRHESSFPAIQDLIQKGTTTRLPQERPAMRAAEERFPLPDDRLDVYPDEDMLIDAAVGGSGRERRPGEKPKDIPTVRVGVTHGDLHHVDDRPVLVGHYIGDTLISAERALDRRLDGQLSEIRDLRIYPGPIGSSEVVLHERAGAIVVGLGEVGDLGPLHLQQTLRHGLLRYARTVAEHERLAVGQKQVTNYGVAIAALLIGTGTGGVSIEESIRAILQAVANANQALWSQGLPVRIADLELFELYEDLAISAAKVLQNLPETSWKSDFAFETSVKHARGGQRRSMFEEAPGWWRRVQILAQQDGSLKYATPTDKARIEVRVQPTQRKLIDKFVSDATRLRRRDTNVEQTLFELLLPNQLKVHVSNQRDLVLMVDKETARYPWEMLNDFQQRTAGEGSHEPMIVRQGVVRQLYGQDFRERTVFALDRNALVIGDPPSKFPELLGAQEEAKAVTELLITGDYQARSLVGKEANPITVVEALFAQHYKVVHLAGHGVYRYLPEDDKDELDEDEDDRRYEPQRVSGMVLGNGIFLSPTEVEQMRVVPELVFINCCLLGRIEPEAREHQPKQLYTERSALAANLATQFIQMGARAVVAAGWEVEDAAAQTFAKEFYRAMLDGRAFGEAIRDARYQTFVRHGQTNTWGAYQCYGDPDYSLEKDRDGSTQHGKSPAYVSPREALIDIGNVIAMAKKSGDEGNEAQTNAADLVQRLQDIEERAEDSWLTDPECADIQTKLGEVYGEIGEFQTAISWYDKAIANANPEKDADYPAKAIDQRANLLARSAESLATRGDLKAAVKQIDRAIQNLDRLAQIQESAERYSVIASACKRKAQLQGLGREDRLAALSHCAEAYFAAAEYAFERTGEYDPYPAINALAIEQVLQWNDKVVSHPKVAPEKLMSALESADWSKTPLDFWQRSYPYDLAFVKSMRLDRLDKDQKKLVKGYRELLQYASPRERLGHPTAAIPSQICAEAQKARHQEYHHYASVTK